MTGARSAVLAVAAALLTAAARAAAPVTPFEAGEAAYAAKDYARARALYERAATEGDATAQDRLGDLYYDGLGAARDEVKARFWYEAAARQNDPWGRYHLADMLLGGRGGPADLPRAELLFKDAYPTIPAAAAKLCKLYGLNNGPRDYAQALSWCRKVETMPYARFLLAGLYETGRGVEKDEAKALELYEGSARDGRWALPANNAAYMLANGLGTKADPQRAYAWYLLGEPSADAEDAKARAGLERNLDAAAKKEAHREVRRILAGAKSWEGREPARRPGGH